MAWSRSATPTRAATGDGPLFTVADLSTVWVELSVFPRDLAKVRVGQVARVKSGDAGLAAEGKVVYVAPFGSSSNQTLTARVQLPNHDRKWPPGLYVNAEVMLSSATVPLTVQTGALQTLDGDTVVFVRNEGFEPRPVKIGRTDGDMAEVLEGLSEGESYATFNSFILKAELGKGEAAHEDWARHDRRTTPLLHRAPLDVMFRRADLAAAGVWSYQRLPIDAVPDITNVQVQINTQAPGYSPLEVEQRITYLVETAIAGVPKIDYTRSLSRYGLSQVTVVFDDGTDIYFARNLVNERLQQAKGQLPQGIEPEMGPIASGLGEIFSYTVHASEAARQSTGEPYDATALRKRAGLGDPPARFPRSIVSIPSPRISMPAPHNTSRAQSRITGSIHGDADDSMAMTSTVVASGIVTTMATIAAQMVRSMSGHLTTACRCVCRCRQIAVGASQNISRSLRIPDNRHPTPDHAADSPLPRCYNPPPPK